MSVFRRITKRGLAINERGEDPEDEIIDIRRLGIDRRKFYQSILSIDGRCPYR
jgi:hypothetical protein